MQTASFGIGEVIERIQHLVPPGSPEPQAPEILAPLCHLTQDLIRAYQAAGRLQADPFYEAQTRQLHLYEADVRRQLAHKVVLVTGGEGCVGTQLIKQLVALGAKRIISVDQARCGKEPSVKPIAALQPSVIYYAADIRDAAALGAIFAIEAPEIVFHLAAQRLPWLAEKEIRETVTTNVFGTQTLIRLCEEYRVQQCVFSSTGKASRYFTAEVYAASKKVAEWLFAQAAQVGKVRYSMVRFTHMLDNSSMCQQIDEKIEQNKPVNIHAPDRYVAGQNVGEAVHLLLNALIFSEPGRLKFLLVRNLGWPTESLEVALYKILQSGKNLPVYFQGIQPGYEELFFLGQVDWDNQIDINTLINALETAHSSEISTSGDMLLAELMPFWDSVLLEGLPSLYALSNDSLASGMTIKQALAELVRKVAASTLLSTTPQKVLQILCWGVNPKHVRQGNLRLSDHRDIVELLVHALHGRIAADVLQACNLSLTAFEELLTVLETLPSVRADVAQMQAVANDIAGTPDLTVSTSVSAAALHEAPA